MTTFGAGVRDRIRNPKPVKIRVRKLAIGTVLTLAASVVEVIAALRLGGWVAIVLLLVAAKNVIYVTLAYAGLLAMSLEAAKPEVQR